MLKACGDWVKRAVSWVSSGQGQRSGGRPQRRARPCVEELEPLTLMSATVVVKPTIVNVIPAAMSAETDQNSEPNIAVNPLNRKQVVIGTFGESGNPYFVSQNGGLTWSNFVDPNPNH